MARYLAPVALLPGGWAEEVVLDVDGHGSIRSVTTDLPAPGWEVDTRLPGVVVPGVVNAHSHAFQRALAGGAETRTGIGDSFWSWREQMYRFLGTMSPDEMEAVAAQLYLELLRHGYTRVVEFHYLHNDPEGVPYDDPAELSRRLVRAADRVGIGITLLPVLYRASDFGGVAPGEGQRRFVLEVEAFLRLVDEIRSWDSPLVSGGVGFHSLRAVPPEAMKDVLDMVGAAPLPLHIHVAEQPREVEACRAWSGQRPVEWLLGNMPVDARWSLVHCTHMTDRETRALVDSGATAVVCPTTEANLGDGLFPLRRHQELGGSLAVGSDSHVSTSPVEEIRWLEYGQRLRQGIRAVGARDDVPSVGRSLLDRVWAGGRSSAGVPAGSLAPGQRADFLVLDRSHPALTGRTGNGVLDAWIFSGNDNPVREVWVAGRRRTMEGRHPEDRAITASFRAVMRRLLTSS
jgi:formimidoylglutamate deiminase